MKADRPDMEKKPGYYKGTFDRQRLLLDVIATPVIMLLYLFIVLVVLIAAIPFSPVIVIASFFIFNPLKQKDKAKVVLISMAYLLGFTASCFISCFAFKLIF